MSYAKVSIFPYVLAVIVFAISGYYGLEKYAVLYAYQKEIGANDSVSTQLNSVLEPLKEEHKSAESSAEETSVDKREAIASIFTKSEEITNLTREIDNFFVKYNASNEPLFLSNLTFSEPMINEDADYAILPFQMDIKSSETNFYRFLEYMENSGSFENKIRLMNIQQIDINFETFSNENTAGTEGENSAIANQKTINFTVTAAAYFQKPAKGGNRL